MVSELGLFCSLEKQQTLEEKLGLAWNSKDFLSCLLFICIFLYMV